MTLFYASLRDAKYMRMIMHDTNTELEVFVPSYFWSTQYDSYVLWVRLHSYSVFL